MKKLILNTLALLFLGIAPSSFAANHDIYLADIVFKDGVPSFSNFLQLTDSPGYDNQPHFLADGRRLLYTSEVVEKMDIKVYDIETKKTRFFKKTPKTSEY